MSDYLRTITSFLPQLIVSHAIAGPISEPTVERLTAGALFADIAGFTALTEGLAARGPAGAEALTGILNGYFGRVIDEVAAAGGDIVKFAGDALLAIWPVGETPPEDVVHGIAACGLRLQSAMAGIEPAPGIGLSMKIAIGFGDLAIERLGGVYDRWELLLAGDALRQLGQGNDAAAPGQVVLSPSAARLLRGEAITVPTAGNGVRLMHLAPRELAPLSPPTLPLPSLAPALLTFLPAAIRDRLDAGRRAFMGELRRVSIIFLNLPDFGVETPLALAQEAMRSLQAGLYRFEGSVNKISVDDKGASLIAVLGLPPLSHGDDPERAVRAAEGMREGLGRLGLRSSIGVTTGTAFCGPLGNETRREYTVMGDVVNMAARLMQAADGAILCDAATERAVRRRLALEALPPITVKGKREPQTVFRPVPHVGIPPAAPAGRSKVIGRQDELRQFETAMRTVRERGSRRLILVEGDAGMGKGRLLQEYLRRGKAAGWSCASTAGDAIDQRTPYRAAGQLLAQLLPAIGEAEDADAARLALLSALPADDDLLRAAPLLNAVLAADLPDTPAMQSLTPQAKAAKTAETIARLVGGLARQRPVLLLVKDAQWLDATSRDVLLQLATLDAPLMMVLAVRPLTAEQQADWSAMLMRTDLQKLVLAAFDPAEILMLVRRRLGIDEVPAEIARYIVDQAEGNPLFAEEMAMTLKEDGHLVLQGRTARAGPGFGSGRHDLPRTLEGFITSRIDKLDPDEQMTIKVASVVGRVFGSGAVSAIHPLAMPPEQVQAQCVNLDRLELTPALKETSLLAGALGGTGFKFKSNLIKEVAYNLMLFAQRQELHLRMAAWLEAHADLGDPAILSLLAHHWRHAAGDGIQVVEHAMKAARCYAALGKVAFTRAAVREALAAFGDALALLDRLGSDPAMTTLRLDITLDLATARMTAFGWEDAEAVALLEQARGLAGDMARVFPILRGRWQSAIGGSNYELAGKLAVEMQVLAEAAGDDAMTIEASRAIGSSVFWTGNFAGAAAAFERALSLYDRSRHAGLAQVFGLDPEVGIRGILAWALAGLGRVGEARQAVAEAVARACDLQHAFSEVYAHGAGMWLHFFLDEPAASLGHAARARDIALERGFTYLAVAAGVVHGWAVGAIGSAEGGADEAAAVLRGWELSGASIGVPLFLMTVGRAHFEAGDRSRARAALEDPRLVARVGVESWYAGERLRLLASLEAQDGHHERARGELQRAVTLARSQCNRLLLLRLAVAAAAIDPVVVAELKGSALAYWPEPVPDPAVQRILRGIEVAG